MNQTQKNEYYRLRAKEFLLSLAQMRTFIKDHNPSRGAICESILRDFLRKILPAIAKVSQGFVDYHGVLSNQCDIIIYDHIHFAPLYSYGEIEIIPSQAVYAVIEVKTRISPKSFGDVLYAFDRLYKLKVNNKFLFLFEGCNVRKIKDYFYSKYIPSYDRKEGQQLYDHDNYDSLPDAIISLSPDYYLRKGYVEDWKGYMSFAIKDDADKEIACLQKFVDDMQSPFFPPQNEDSLLIKSDLLSDNDDLKDIVFNEGFGLVPL